jgi:hypothetical protein
MSILTLHAKIEVGKRHLIRLAQRYGRTDLRVLAQSEAVDELINQYMRGQIHAK